MRRTLASFLTAVMAFNTVSVLSCLDVRAETRFGGGSGTAEDPYIVSTADHLNEVRYALDACFVQTQDIDLSKYQLWQPISGFSGTYDGGGFSVTELSGIRTVEGTSSSGYIAGLFGVNRGTIRNLSAEDCSVSVSASYAGIIAADNYGTISDCSVSGSLTLSGSGLVHAGGIAGRSSGTVSGCENNASVASGRNAGGIAGIGSGTISSCSNTAEIKGIYAGGIVGATVSIADSFDINGCVNMGAITAMDSSMPTAGGIAGHLGTGYTAYVTDCYNTGTISGPGSFAYMGGIAGFGHYAQMSNCYNTGTLPYSITSCGEIAGTVSSADQIENCYYVSGEGKTGSGYATGGSPKETAEAKSIEEIAALTETLNNGRAERIWSNDILAQNRGLPVLSWQNSAADVTADHIPGSYDVPFTLSLIGRGICDIYYTLDGSDPTSSETRMQYTEPFTIQPGVTTVKAYAQYAAGAGNVTEFVYKVTKYPIKASVQPGGYTEAVTVGLSVDEPTAAIYYTTDGTDPTVLGVRYTAPIELYGSAVIKAAAFANGETGDVCTFEYTLVSELTSDRESGSYPNPIEITLEGSIPQHDIYYTLDGSDPTAGGTKYTEPVHIYNSLTLKAAAVYDSVWGEVYTYDYTIPTAEITVSPSAGTYYEAQTAELSCSMPGCTLLYTTDGGDPAAYGTEYADGIEMGETTVIRAAAMWGDVPIAEETFEYTIIHPELNADISSMTYEDGRFYITAAVSNTYPDTERMNFYTAAYDGEGRLIDLAVSEYAYRSGSSQNTEIRYAPKADLKADGKIKVMAWRPDTLEPCGAVYERSVSDFPLPELSHITAPSSISANYGSDPRSVTVTAYYTEGKSAATVSSYTHTSSNTSVAYIANGRIVFGEPGSAVITLSYTEGGITKTAQISVTVSIPMYSTDPTVPDYGALNGVSPLVSEQQSSGYAYAYTLPANTSFVEKYCTALEKTGYYLEPELSDGSSGYITYLDKLTLTTGVRIQTTDKFLHILIVYYR